MSAKVLRLLLKPALLTIIISFYQRIFGIVKQYFAKLHVTYEIPLQLLHTQTDRYSGMKADMRFADLCVRPTDLAHLTQAHKMVEDRMVSRANRSDPKTQIV